VRELENALGHACMMVLGDMIDVPDLPDYLRTPGGNLPAGSARPAAEAPHAPAAETGGLEDYERELVARAMQAAGGNQTQAARMLRIGRDALRYKLKKYNLQN
jgi:DNA-binding NtrC family response regulator